MYRWLTARLDPSIDVMMGVLQNEMTTSLLDMPSPFLMRLQPLPSSIGGIWIVWATSPFAFSITESVERIVQSLEALLEVEEKEDLYFSASSPLYDRELVEAMAYGDNQALSAFLSLTRLVGKADFAFWARAYQDFIETTSYLGAKRNGFGFALARGQGIGGRVVAYGTPFIGDYLNSPYRDPSVCSIVDDEQVRSGMALPIRYSTAPDMKAHVAAVLYVTRRAVIPFTLAERLLIQRLIALLEPLPIGNHPTTFASASVQHLSEHKMAWYDIVMYASQIEVVEAWASHLIKGSVIVTNSEGNPYVFAHNEQIEQMKAPRGGQPDVTQILSLATPGTPTPGQVYLSPSIPLPPPQWPDFFADLIVACNVVVARMEQTQDQLNRRRERWLLMLLKGELSQHIEQDGYRLGLPVEHGQLWVLVWSSEAAPTTKQARKRLLAESAVLDSMKSPLIFLEDDMAVILLEGQVSQSPSKVRDTLLKHFSPYPLWIVHGGRYQSLHELKMTLTHTISLGQKARREKYAEYLLDIYTFGLDSLLENPRLAEELNAFATKLLSPLIEHDATSSSHLTETFVLVQTLGSVQEVADRLGVHANTVRYRLHRAEDILGTTQSSPKEHTALALAAFTWKRFHTND